MKVLILCTGNSCRSQMAEGFLRSFSSKLDVHSAGTNPAQRVHPLAVQVMSEVGLDISAHTTKLVDKFVTDSFDYVITVCDHAKETCPLFTGKVLHRLHIGFDDPAEAAGTPDEVIAVFRRVRDEIRRDFQRLYNDTLLPDLARRRS
jgi:arsenate reductase